MAVNFDGKEKINTLLNIGNYFGEFQGKTLPIVIFIGVVAAPLLGWLFILQMAVPFLWFLPIWIIWIIHWALVIPGKEKEKMKQYDTQRSDEYKAADELIHTSHIHEDGLIEYQSGTVAYILTGFMKDFIKDKKMSLALEVLFEELDMWNWDYFAQNVVDEVLTEDGLPNCAKYVDKQVIADRIDFYNYQDNYSRNHTSLYRHVFLVYSSKVNWKKMRNHLEELVSSETCDCFNEIYICDKKQVSDICNRDLCAYVDLMSMLTKKYDNDEFYGSKVMWYDSDVPEKLKPKKEKSSMTRRRVSKKGD